MEMQLLLLTVGLALDCGLQGQVEGHEQEELDPQMDLLELSGRRHTATLASNNSALIRRSGRFRVFIDRLDVEEGDLQAQILVPSVQGQDWGQNHLYLAKMKPTEFPNLHVTNQ